MTSQIIIDFNDTLLSLALNIADVCPNSLIGSHIKDIEKALKRKENHKKCIDMFCLKVLKYKEQIDAGEEDFFMKKDYGNDIKEHNEIDISHVVSFKGIWKDLKQENKQIVICSMQILCELAQQYFDIIYG